MGSKSLLRRTLDRVKLAVPAERTVVVATRAHAPFFSRELSSPGGPKLLVQPGDRGTAAGVLLPVQWIASRDAGAIVAVFPSDHFVADDAAFMGHAGRLAGVAARHPDRIVLVGARPDTPESGYGWIEPGPALEESPDGRVFAVRQFREKPSPEIAQACLSAGGLWNTFVMVAKASALMEAARITLPELHRRVTEAAASFGTDSEEAAIERAYRLVPASNFSKAILASSPSLLAVSPLPPMTWSDWGTPERVIGTLRDRGIAPPWMLQIANSGADLSTGAI
jgi:mannose-1-phosphate guanylyltransferase